MCGWMPSPAFYLTNLLINYGANVRPLKTFSLYQKRLLSLFHNIRMESLNVCIWTRVTININLYFNKWNHDTVNYKKWTISTICNHYKLYELDYIGLSIFYMNKHLVVNKYKYNSLMVIINIELLSLVIIRKTYILVSFRRKRENWVIIVTYLFGKYHLNVFNCFMLVCSKQREN